MEQHECGLYKITTNCGDTFFYEVKSGNYEIDIFCPRCMEHMTSLAVEGDYFESFRQAGKGVRVCSSLDIMKLKLTLSKSFANLSGEDLAGKKTS